MIDCVCLCDKMDRKVDVIGKEMAEQTSTLQDLSQMTFMTQDSVNSLLLQVKGKYPNLSEEDADRYFQIRIDMKRSEGEEMDEERMGEYERELQEILGRVWKGSEDDPIDF